MKSLIPSLLIVFAFSMLCQVQQLEAQPALGPILEVDPDSEAARRGLETVGRARARGRGDGE